MKTMFTHPGRVHLRRGVPNGTLGGDLALHSCNLNHNNDLSKKNCPRRVAPDPGRLSTLRSKAPTYRDFKKRSSDSYVATIQVGKYVYYGSRRLYLGEKGPLWLTFENQTFVVDNFRQSERDDSPVNFLLYGFALLPSPYVLDDPAFEKV